MALTNSPTQQTVSLTVSRTFDATPERVFEAWLDPEQVVKWLRNPAPGTQTEAQALEPRVGGSYRLHIRRPSGATTISGVYREITRYTKLAFTWTWSQSGSTAECKSGDPGMACETLVTVTFRAVGKKTELTLVHENFLTPEARDAHEKGWTCGLDQLGEVLGS